MPVKSKKVRAKKSPSRVTAAAKKKKNKNMDSISAEEASALEIDAARRAKSENAWLSLAAPQGEDGDDWNKVEENLQAKSQERGRSWQRWKYFSK